MERLLIHISASDAEARYSSGHISLDLCTNPDASKEAGNKKATLPVLVETQLLTVLNFDLLKSYCGRTGFVGTHAFVDTLKSA